MKKTRSCLLIAFLAACLLSGCGEQERAEASTVSGESFRTAAQTELTEDAESLYSLSEQYRITTLGMVEGNPKVLPEPLCTVSADELPKTVPIFADPYPFNQAGAMFEVDDAYREESAAAIERYMRLLFGSDFTLNSVAVEETERRSHYTFGGYTVSGDPTGISLLCEADVSSAESLMKSPAVSAMLVYCGIEKPCVRKTVTGADGNAYRYTITAAYADAFQNGMESGFSYVLAEGRIGEGTVRLGGTVIDHSEVYAVGTPISPEVAAADLRGRLAERTGDCEIVAYEMAYRNDVDYGYIIPCYMFYVKQAGREDYDLYPYRMCLYTARGSAPQALT